MNIDAAHLSILLPALLAGLLVTATHVPLGMQVLDRGIVFIDLAVAQVAGVGVILADSLGWDVPPWESLLARAPAMLEGGYALPAASAG